jgi:hypothetical protein
MNRALARLKKWTEDNRLTINASKTTYDFYTTAHQVPEIKLYLGNDKIEYCGNPTYLGITLDRKLKGKSHISQTADRGKRRLALMRRVAGVKWGCTMETLANMYKTYVRPTLEYGMEVFPAAIPNETKQLDIVQNQALRIITGGVKTTPIAAMEIYTGIEPLNARRDSAVMVLHEKLDPSWETPHTARLKTHKTFIERANEIKSEYELDVLENRKEKITVMPLCNTLIDIEYEIKIEGMEHNKNTYSEYELKAHTLRYIHSQYGDLQTNKLHLSAPARTSFDVTNSNEVYKAHETLSRIWHKLIQNIILSVFFLYKKIYYLTNIALRIPKCKINIVKRHRGRSSNYFTCNPCGAPEKFGGDWRSPMETYRSMDTSIY